MTRCGDIRRYAYKIYAYKEIEADTAYRDRYSLPRYGYKETSGETAVRTHKEIRVLIAVSHIMRHKERRLNQIRLAPYGLKLGPRA